MSHPQLPARRLIKRGAAYWRRRALRAEVERDAARAMTVRVADHLVAAAEVLAVLAERRERRRA